MTIELKMPALGPEMEAGTLSKWLVREGDWLAAGDLIAEIETEKATMEFEAVDQGVVSKLLVREGDEVAVGTTIAIINEEVIGSQVRVEPHRSVIPEPGILWTRSRSALPVEIAVVNADITRREGDVILLKHADGFYGVDAIVAQQCAFDDRVPEGEFRMIDGQALGGKKVVFAGVGNLYDFRYASIKRFAAAALRFLHTAAANTKVLLSPVHGSGYGLDEGEAFLSLISGFVDAIDRGEYPRSLRRLEIVERDPAKAIRLSRLLSDLVTDKPQAGSMTTSPPGLIDEQELVSFGAASEAKPKLFVAMPFAEEFDDIWKIGIQEACSFADVLCERIDEKHFVGSVVDEIRKSVSSSRGIIAVLDGANANVFLEIGFAWGLNKPTILLASSVDNVPFDVRGQKCIFYRKSVHRLREALRAELIGLKAEGTLQ